MLPLPRPVRRLAAPPHFYAFARRLQAPLGWLAALLLMGGTAWALALAPADYQQGESYRIMYVHVPAAWLSLLAYTAMAACGGCYLVWRVKVMDHLAAACAAPGAWFTVLALATGSLWGRPMWGTWWEWGDARMLSELILLLLYLGVIALRASVDEPERAGRAAALLAVVGVVNVPIVHFSVEWWNTLHQGPSVLRADGPAIHPSMLAPLAVMALGFTLYFAALVLARARCEVLARAHRARWLREG
jgi:heme exporter protein C